MIILSCRCIGPFLLSDAQGESFIRLTPKELLLVDCMRTRLNNIMEERAEAEERMLKEASSTLPSTMQWSAKIHTILPGKEIRIPIPSLPEDATLEW
jgi:adenosyl cobinamide kinase/adenosyl cobinamide phosphate guanylyltransferase